MRRTLCVLLLTVAIGGCDRPATPPDRSHDTGRAPARAAPSQSIMQPKVIAEVEPTPTPTSTPLPVTGITVAFPQGIRLDDAGKAQLDALLARSELPGGATWVLRGSSDSAGGDQANLASSRRRAMAVRDYLVDHGIDAERITVIALGERRPVAPNAMLDGSDDPAGRARNRRVDIEIVPPTAPASAPGPVASEPVGAE